MTKPLDHTKSATITVFCNDKEINYNIYSIEVDKAVNRLAAARIILSDTKVSETDDFIPGAKIKIEAGYGVQNKVIFEGLVVKCVLKNLQRGAPSLIVDCRDAAYRMTLESKNAIFYNQTDSDLISRLAKDYDLGVRASETELAHKVLVQYQVSDWEFALNRAMCSGKYLYTDDGTLVVASPDTRAKEKLTLRPDHNMIEFEAALESRYQLPRSSGTFWDPGEQQLVEAGAQVPATAQPGEDQKGEDRKREKDEGGNITSMKLAALGKQHGEVMRLSGNYPSAELKAITTARMLQSRLSKIRGRIRHQGTFQVKPSDMVKLEKISKRFDGKAFVSGIRHTIDQSNWETDIQIGMSEEWISQIRPSDTSNRGYRLIPPIEGLHIGVVTGLTGDPLAEQRIQVRVPVLDGEKEGIWARLAVEYAGSERGMVFRPEIGNEVILGFLQGDPRQAIILGRLHSSKRTAPISDANGQNEQKGIITRAGMKILFDEQRKSVNIESPGGKSMAINDLEGQVIIKDENNNQLIMAKEGMKLNATGNLDINCAGSLSIKAPSVQITGADFNCQASNVMMNGNASVALTGGSVTIIPPPN